MPQEFMIVRCCECETFQVQLVKKVPKWACKVCGQKQSVKKVYGQGAASDCRQGVQELNMQRKQADEAVSDQLLDDEPDYPYSMESEHVPQAHHSSHHVPQAHHSSHHDHSGQMQEIKWNKFVEPNEDEHVDHDLDYSATGRVETFKNTVSNSGRSDGRVKGNSQHTHYGRNMDYDYGYNPH